MSNKIITSTDELNKVVEKAVNNALKGSYPEKMSYDLALEYILKNGRRIKINTLYDYANRGYIRKDGKGRKALLYRDDIYQYFFGE